MNAFEIAIAGITIVFITLSILAFIIYITGKILSKSGRQEEKIAAIIAKLHQEGKL